MRTFTMQGLFVVHARDCIRYPEILAFDSARRYCLRHFPKCRDWTVPVWTRRWKRQSCPVRLRLGVDTWDSYPLDPSPEN